MSALRPLIAALAVVLLGLPATAPLQAEPQFPKLTGRVVDSGEILPPDIEARIEQKLAALEAQSHRQLVVATIGDLQGYDIADYGYQLGRAWGIGSEQRNDGALLIVAPKERKVRIEVGYGLEGTLTDGLSSLIISQEIVPKFKAGDLPGGVEAGTDAIIRQLTLPPDEAKQIAAEAEQEDTGSVWPLFFVLGFFGLFIWIIVRAAREGGRRYAGAGLPVAVWGSGSDSSSSSWSDSSSSSSFDSDFSGGGGDFGGGGASGDW